VLMLMLVLMFMVVAMFVFMSVRVLMVVIVTMPMLVFVVMSADTRWGLAWQSASTIFTHSLLYLYCRQFQFPARSKVAAGLVADRAIGKQVLGPKLTSAIGAPKPRRDFLDGQFSAFSQRAWGQSFEGKFQRLRHHAA
jgi:hypothetical protein